MPDGIEKFSQNTFEQIKHVDENGVEYWSARELYPVLEYTEWRNFRKVIEKAKTAKNNTQLVDIVNFVEINKIVTVGNGMKREIDDVQLSRYACSLIVQNGDPSKPVIAAGQTYFAVQTRKQEILEEHFRQLDDDEKRLYLRQELREHNKLLVDAAKNAGVETNLDYAVFQNSGYKGLTIPGVKPALLLLLLLFSFCCMAKDLYLKPSRVLSADTFEADGKTYHLVGIKAPSGHWGDVARREMEKMLKGKEYKLLHFPPKGKTGKGTELRVFFGNFGRNGKPQKNPSVELLKKGLARYAPAGLDDLRRKPYHPAEEYAKKHKLGIWSHHHGPDKKK